MAIHLKPIFKANDIPDEWKRIYAPFEPDWRPEQMHGLPRMLPSSMCGCYMHNASNYQEWIMCPTHAAAPELLEALKALNSPTTWFDEEAHDCRYCGACNEGLIIHFSFCEITKAEAAIRKAERK